MFNHSKIDADFRKQSGLSDKRYYKIYYSHIHPFPIIVLGFNPGGETDGTDLNASKSFYENWEHDYVKYRRNPKYAIAAPIYNLLSFVLRTDDPQIIRQIPATNVIFHRSRNENKLNMQPIQAAREAQPFLNKIIEEVNPHIVLCVAKTAYDLFKKLHVENGTLTEDKNSQITTPNGRSPAVIYQRNIGVLSATNKKIPILLIGHPSKYASRNEWSGVRESLVKDFEENGIDLNLITKFLQKIPPLADHS